MAITINISDGTVTVELNDGTCAWTDNYNPDNLGLSADEVTEGHMVTFVGGNTTIDANWLKLEKLFLQARVWQASRKGTRVYVQVSLDGTNTWRSELLDGRVVPTPNIVKYERATGQREATVIVRRANWWEGAEAQVALTNGNGTDNTTGLTVYNCNDGVGTSPTKRNSYAAIAAASVGGDLPAETRLEIINTFATSQLYFVWVGQNWTDPANFVPVLEAESGTGGTIVANANYSNGNYTTHTLTTTEADLLSWTLNAAFLNACKGNYYKAVLKTDSTITGNMKFRLKIKWNVSTLWQSDQIQIGSPVLAVSDLVTFRLPPWLPALSALDGVDLIITAQSTSGSHPLRVDWLQLMPTDGWRQLSYIGYGLANGRRIVDDGVRGYLYEDDAAGAGLIGNMVGYGSPIKLYPGKDQRLYFMLHAIAATTSEITRTISVKLFYRPRRLSL